MLASFKCLIGSILVRSFGQADQRAGLIGIDQVGRDAPGDRLSGGQRV